MSGRLRVLLEIGTKGRRIVAAATDWPGLDRGGASEDVAVQKIASYRPRYARVAERAGLADDFARQREIDVIERYRGSSSTDFWGIAHVPSSTEAAGLTDTELERRLGLLRACWATFDDVVAGVSSDLRPGSRGGGRSRDQIVRHVYGTEPHNFSRKVGVRTPLEAVFTSSGLDAHRAAYLEAIRAFHADGRQARTWPLAFLIRRTAQHVMDHAWELEDRDPIHEEGAAQARGFPRERYA